MKRHRHTPEQIVRKLREGERLLNEGRDITEVVRHLEIAESTWNRWRSQYGGMKADEAKRLRRLETENARLKRLLRHRVLDWLKSTAKGTQARRTANAHAWTMVTVTVLVLAGIAVRVVTFWDESSTPGIALALTLAAAALTGLGGTIGGSLVYDYGFNVETAGDHPVWHASELDVLPGDKT